MRFPGRSGLVQGTALGIASVAFQILGLICTFASQSPTNLPSTLIFPVFPPISKLLEPQDLL